MKELEYLLAKESLTPEETALLIGKIKRDIWPRLLRQGKRVGSRDICGLFSDSDLTVGL